MNTFNKILLIPCLTPLLVVIILSSFNLDKTVRIKLLTWTSPSMSLGIIMAIGSCTSSILAYSTSFALNSKHNTLSRNLHFNTKKVETFDEFYGSNKDTFISNTTQNNQNVNDYGPERSLHDPKPTLSVPFRVIGQSSQKFANNNYDYEDNFAEEDINMTNRNELFKNQEPNSKDLEDGWGESFEENW